VRKDRGGGAQFPFVGMVYGRSECEGGIKKREVDLGKKSPDSTVAFHTKPMGNTSACKRLSFP